MPGVIEEVSFQRVLADEEENLITPAGKVPGGKVEDDVDEAPDVLDADSLGVQVDDGSGFMQEHGMVEVAAATAGVIGELGVGVVVGVAVVDGVGVIVGSDGELTSRKLVRSACGMGGRIALLGGKCGVLLGLDRAGERSIAPGLGLVTLLVLSIVG